MSKIDYTLTDMQTLNSKGLKALVKAREKRDSHEFKRMSKEKQKSLLKAMRLMAK